MTLTPQHAPIAYRETLSADVNRIMSEAENWQRIMGLEADTSVVVYLDMKSPHAYIAVRPTLEVARDYPNQD